MRWRILLVVSLALFVAVSCDQQPVEPQTQEVATPLFNGVHGNQVVHSVSVGSHDMCAPGCDANFSLTAQQRADGTVTGEWTDVWGRGALTVHVTLDCLEVDGNEAWFSGYLTVPGWAYGAQAGGRVVDNGKSANDPPDQISFIEWDGSACDTRPDYDLYDLYDGQVVVR